MNLGILISWVRHRLDRHSRPQEAEGDPWATFLQGRALDGHRDAPGAFRCYMVAAQAGHVTAGTLTGLCYKTGHGALADPVAGRAWLEKSATLGEPGARVLLGVVSEEEAP